MKMRLVFPVAGVVVTLLVVLAVRTFDRPPAREGPPREGDLGNYLLPRGPGTAETPGGPAPTPALAVRDLADGSPVDGATVGDEIREPGAPVLGAAGYLAVSTPDEARAEGVLWVRRDVRITGTVTGRSATTKLDPRDVSLSAVYRQIEGAPIPGPDWLAAHGLGAPVVLDAPGPDGAFAATAPRVAGLSLTASAKGWSEARADLTVTAATDTAEAALVLDRAIALEGTLADAAGNPVSGATVVAYTMFKVPASACDREKLNEMYPDGGISVVRRGGEDSARATLATFGRTDESGKFRLALREEGEVRFVAFAAGFALVEQDAGHVDADRAELSFTAEPSGRTGAVVRLTQGGEPLRRCRVAVTDYSRPEVKPGCTMETDEEGRLSAEWLTPGRKYAFTLLGGPAAGTPDAAPPAGRLMVTWKDQGELAIPPPRR